MPGLACYPPGSHNQPTMSPELIELHGDVLNSHAYMIFNEQWECLLTQMCAELK